MLYLIGMYLGKLFIEERKVHTIFIICPLILQILQMVISSNLSDPCLQYVKDPVRDLTYSSLAITLCFCIAYCFDYFNEGHLLKQWTEFLGSISLESYLWNTYWGYFLSIAIVNGWLTKSVDLMYAYIGSCIIGLLLSKPYKHS